MSQFVNHNDTGVTIWKVASPPVICATLPNCAKATEVAVSPNGKYLLVVSANNLLKVFAIPNYNKPLHEIKTHESTVKFSPQSNFIACGFSQNYQSKNLQIYNVASAELIAELVDAKRELIDWSDDESIAYRMVGAELMFYEANNFANARKLSQKIVSYSFATNRANKCNYVAVFIKGAKAAPSSIKVFKYPVFDNAVASKSLFKIDSASFKWNPKGDALLIMAANDVDTTGSSYYGQTTLHFMDLKGNSCSVSGKKEGSIHDCQWLPTNDGFIVVYGKMPASVTLYNNKADVVFEFKESVVNSININPFGNLVAFSGFGNLSGNIHIWNLKTKTVIAEFNARDTTHFSWTADGGHILTSTQFERLRVENGFKLWNYLGVLLHTEDMKREASTPLHSLLPISSDQFREPTISANAKGKLFSDTPKTVYVPPSMQTRQQQLKMDKLKKQLASNSAEVGNNSGLSVREKKIKNLSKKLEQIEQLKKSLADGKQLEKNQLEKIQKEGEIVNEINMLKLEA